MPSQQLINIIIKATDEASAAAQKVDENLRKIGDSSSRLSRIPGFDTMKTKLSSVAQSIDGKLGGALSKAGAKLSNFSNRVSNVGSTIKSKLGNALSSVSNKFKSFGNAANGAGQGLGFLKSAGSMAVGMLGFELANSIMETTRASLNARSGIQAFAKRLNMSGTEVTAFQKSLDELQNTYKKIDMDVVGQQATDMAYRLGLPKTSLAELTETTAIFTDAMQRNGRSAEDSMLAMSDAMDGQFVRLKEIGIGQDDLMKNGWSGDLNDKTGLLKAMNKALKEQHYDDLAKSVDTLDDAWQVLSITLSNLLESILLPLTPAIVGLINGFISAVNMIKAAWNGLPDWGKAAIGIGAVAVAIGLIGGAISAVGIAGIPILGTLVAAIGAISWPVVAVAAAIGALVYAIYEVGKAFGWWKDVNTMLEAISAGLQRMWSAFINHPDVQAAIRVIGDAFNWICGAIGNTINWIVQFFNINSSGSFDAVHAIILAIGAAWEGMTFPIRTVIGIILWLIEAFQNLQASVTPIWMNIMTVIGPILSAIIGLVYSLINAFNSFRNGQMTLPQFIMTVLSLVWTAYLTVTTQILALIGRFASQVFSKAVQAGRNFLNGVMNNIRQLPGQVGSALLQVVSAIVSAGAQWVSNAVSKASELVSTVTSTLSGLPGAISGALGGVVDAIVSPFRSAYDAVCGVVDSIKSKVSAAANAIASLGSARGGDNPMGGDSVLSVSDNSIRVSSEPIEVHEELRLVVDLQNVPGDMSEDNLIEVLTSKNVLSALVGNDTFQKLDGKVKEQISSRNYRARGV